MAFKLKLNLRLGEKIIKGSQLEYVDGEVFEWEIDPNVVPFNVLCDMVVEAGYKGVRKIFYLIPRKEIEDGLIECYDNISFVRMTNLIKMYGEIDL